MREISRLAEKLVACPEILCSVELANVVEKISSGTVNSYPVCSFPERFVLTCGEFFD